MMSGNKFIWCSAVVILVCFALQSVDGAPSPNNGYYNEFEGIPDEILMELMTRFGQTLMRARSDLENSKRTVDFGLARGYSGTLEAKHRMGLAAANFPGGPGRRRRSDTDV